jgi:ribosomal protein S27E
MEERNPITEPEKIKCPKCGSTQITAGKHGFSAGKAVGGALLTGGIGLLAGLHGSKKIEITCLNCGNKFKPGEKAKAPVVKTEAQKAGEDKTAGGCVIFIIIAVIIYFVSKGC